MRSRGHCCSCLSSLPFWDGVRPEPKLCDISRTFAESVPWMNDRELALNACYYAHTALKELRTRYPRHEFTITADKEAEATYRRVWKRERGDKWGRWVCIGEAYV